MSRLWCGLRLAAATALLGMATTAIAADEPADVIKYRQAVMKANGAHTGAIVALVKGKVGYDPSHVVAHARGINAMAGLIADAFRQDTGMTGPTKAKPEIWANWADFTAKAKRLGEESAKLIEVAQGGDMAAIGAQLGAMGSACGACHKQYREK